MVRARQVGDGMRRRLLHANEKLSSVRDSLAQARKGVDLALKTTCMQLGLGLVLLLERRETTYSKKPRRMIS